MITWTAMTGFMGAEIAERRLSNIFRSWEGTPYRAGQQMKGPKGGVDCVRFAFGVLDELYGFVRCDVPKLPQDIALHNKTTAMKAMRQLLKLYEPNAKVEDGTVQPGDIVVVAPPNGGPGHALVGGIRPNTLWHSTGQFVQMTGIGLLHAGFMPWKLAAIYRAKDRERWAKV
jgi:hypothetical protein